MVNSFSVGDVVWWQQYEGEWVGPYRVEKKYNDRVFLIVNEHNFVDMVSIYCLRFSEVKESNATDR